NAGSASARWTSAATRWRRAIWCGAAGSRASRCWTSAGGLWGASTGQRSTGCLNCDAARSPKTNRRLGMSRLLLFWGAEGVSRRVRLGGKLRPQPRLNAAVHVVDGREATLDQRIGGDPAAIAAVADQIDGPVLRKLARALRDLVKRDQRCAHRHAGLRPFLCGADVNNDRIVTVAQRVVCLPHVDGRECTWRGSRLGWGRVFLPVVAVAVAGNQRQRKHGQQNQQNPACLVSHQRILPNANFPAAR